MEKQWFPRQNTKDTVPALLKNFIHYLEFPVSKLTIEKDTQAHPEFPFLSLDALIEILQNWGIKSVAYNWEIEKLHEIPSPSLLFIHEQAGNVKAGEFVMYYGFRDDAIEYLHTRKGWVLESREEFNAKWAKAALSVIEIHAEGESDYEEREKKYAEAKNSQAGLKHVFCKDAFLSREECDYIIGLSESRFKRSTVTGNVIGQDDGRTSYSAELVLPEDDILNAIRKRAALLMEMPESHFEFFQCVSYEPKQEYGNHYDTFDETSEAGRKMVAEGGQRKYTLLAYLNDDFEGGGTHFPNLDILVQPKKGRVVIFNNLDDDRKVLPSAYHAGLPVTTGRKYALNMWVRNKPLR